MCWYVSSYCSHILLTFLLVQGIGARDVAMSLRKSHASTFDASTRRHALFASWEIARGPELLGWKVGHGSARSATKPLKGPLDGFR